MPTTKQHQSIEAQPVFTAAAHQHSTTNNNGLFSNSVETFSEGIGNTAKGLNFGLKQRYQMFTNTNKPRSSTVFGINDMTLNKGRGTPMIRFDAPHKGVPYSHINLNIKPDPHIPISNNLFNSVKNSGKFLEKAGKVAKPLGIASDAINLGDAFIEDNYTIGNETIKETSEIAGGWGGAVLGAKAGATVGTTIGTLGGPVGMAAGGFIGGLAGGIIGAMSGDYLGGKVGEFITDDETKDYGMKKWQQVKNFGAETADTLGNTAAALGDWSMEKYKNAKKTSSDFINKFID